MIARAPKAIRWIAALVTLAAARLARAEPVPEQGFGLPRDASVDGHLVDDLIGFTTVATTLVFVVAGAVFLVALVRHRRGHPAVYSHGTKASIGVLVGFVALVALAMDGTLFVHTLADMRRVFWNFQAVEQRADTVRIEVQAHQWAWSARYPGADGEFNTQDDLITLNDIRIPLGAPVLVQLASVDVIHSFNLPNFRVKRDAVPGEITKLTFQAKQEGEYVISCAQHCGANHYKMRGVLTVLPPDRYREWLATAGALASRAYDPDDAEAHWGWRWRTE
jgi:cytochrome c oxidase subunit 2